MMIIVDRDRCAGLGVCESLAPAHFQVGDDGKSAVLSSEVGGDLALFEEAVRSCPVQALKLIAGA
jgi:ferredoxin